MALYTVKDSRQKYYLFFFIENEPEKLMMLSTKDMSMIRLEHISLFIFSLFSNPCLAKSLLSEK